MASKAGVYEIAKYIPVKVRRQMVAVVYKPDKEATHDIRVCKDGKCPMGWLADLGPLPMPSVIARSLERSGLASARATDREKLVAMARAFTDDWDDGKIKNLHKALGVPK